jgi:hypothetical protein
MDEFLDKSKSSTMMGEISEARDLFIGEVGRFHGRSGNSREEDVRPAINASFDTPTCFAN